MNWLRDTFGRLLSSALIAAVSVCGTVVYLAEEARLTARRWWDGG